MVSSGKVMILGADSDIVTLMSPVVFCNYQLDHQRLAQSTHHPAEDPDEFVRRHRLIPCYFCQELINRQPRIDTPGLEDSALDH